MRRNERADKKLPAGGGTVCRTVVTGAGDHEFGQIRAAVAAGTHKAGAKGIRGCSCPLRIKGFTSDYSG